jgi:uncharacterized protein (DUF2147 family)
MMRLERATSRTIAIIAATLMPFAPLSMAKAEQAPTAAQKPAPAMEKLRGRWLRDTGGYIIEIRKVGAGGKVDAAYFNPRPIHVGRAQAVDKGGVVKVSVELRDVNYPGSTYALIYDAKNDRLVGRYFQAVTGESFDVYFVRLKT